MTKGTRGEVYFQEDLAKSIEDGHKTR